jgi:hypothetical protein
VQLSPKSNLFNSIHQIYFPRFESLFLLSKIKLNIINIFSVGYKLKLINIRTEENSKSIYVFDLKSIVPRLFKRASIFYRNFVKQFMESFITKKKMEFLIIYFVHKINEK